MRERLSRRSIAIGLVVWIVAYVVILVATALTNSRYTESAVIFVGGLLLIPWLVGIALGVVLLRRSRP